MVYRCHQPVRGSVRLLDGSPVHSTIVALNGGDFRATTDVDGSFEFSAVPAGKCPPNQLYSPQIEYCFFCGQEYMYVTCSRQITTILK